MGQMQVQKPLGVLIATRTLHRCKAPQPVYENKAGIEYKSFPSNFRNTSLHFIFCFHQVCYEQMIQPSDGPWLCQSSSLRLPEQEVRPVDLEGRELRREVRHEALLWASYIYPDLVACRFETLCATALLFTHRLVRLVTAPSLEKGTMSQQTSSCRMFDFALYVLGFMFEVGLSMPWEQVCCPQ